MSNHYHLDVTDPRGEMPAFKNMFNAFLARALNTLRGRFDSVWSGDAPCDVELLDDDDVLHRMAYTLANPVSAGLVRRAHRWAGFTTAGLQFGQTLTFARPKFFFDPKGTLPDRVRVTIVRPDIFCELSDETLHARLRELVHQREANAAAELRANSRRFLGEQRVVRQRWNEPPRTLEKRFTTTPRVSSRNKWARIAALQQDRAWREVYGERYAAWRDGHDVTFPWGTYALRRLAGVRVEVGP